MKHSYSLPLSLPHSHLSARAQILTNKKAEKSNQIKSRSHIAGNRYILIRLIKKANLILDSNAFHPVTHSLIGRGLEMNESLYRPDWSLPKTVKTRAVHSSTKIESNRRAGKRSSSVGGSVLTWKHTWRLFSVI